MVLLLVMSEVVMMMMRDLPVAVRCLCRDGDRGGVGARKEGRGMYVSLSVVLIESLLQMR